MEQIRNKKKYHLASVVIVILLITYLVSYIFYEIFISL